MACVNISPSVPLPSLPLPLGRENPHWSGHSAPRGQWEEPRRRPPNSFEGWETLLRSLGEQNVCFVESAVLCGDSYINSK